ncbi:glycoside hydrolase family 11 protein [Ruminococcus sp.]|uniref:glycoside hydrolase family 11 protein n=1 Tax=Ruminococcus sp. TaxID=41978 RepID=UPI0025E32F0B|nr:glycoside hydrolase family 11 protein [Ruminococcus sp.]
MSFIDIKKIFSITASAVMLASSVSFSASAVDQQQRGCIGQYSYEMWNQSSVGNVVMEPAYASFTCSWENVDTCLFSIGKNYDNKCQNYKSLLTFERSLDYEVEYSPKGNSFIGLHGWTRNPLTEYFIVEGYGDWVLPPNIEDYGSYYINNKTYNLYKQMVYNQPSLDGTATFPRYWSVCTENCAKSYQNNDIKGYVDLYRTFEVWEELGLDMSGTLYEACLYIENYKSSGSANVKKISINPAGYGAAQILRYAPNMTNPRLSFCDSDGYYYIYNFDSNKIFDWSPYYECALSVSENGYSGIYGDNCILVSDRIEEWDGTFLTVSNNFSSGDSLGFGASVMQDTEESVDFILTVMYEDEEGITQFDEAAAVTAKKGEWTDLSVLSYTIPENAYNTAVRIETKESNTDFYIDNAYVAEAGVRSYMDKLTEENETKSQKGDLNSDGIVDVFDIIPLRRIILEIRLGEEYYNFSADVNCDGIVNIADLVRLQNVILGAEKNKIYETTVATTTTTALITTSSTNMTSFTTTTENENLITTSSASTASYNHITQEKAKEMMLADDNHVIVDVRRQDEYDSGHIPDAILIPNESIDTEQPKELPDLDQVILVYCRSGRRSKEASQKLADMGYTHIYEFGGITEWTGEVVTSP